MFLNSSVGEIAASISGPKQGMAQDFSFSTPSAHESLTCRPYIQVRKRRDGVWLISGLMPGARDAVARAKRVKGEKMETSEFNGYQQAKQAQEAEQAQQNQQALQEQQAQEAQQAPQAQQVNQATPKGGGKRAWLKPLAVGLLVLGVAGGSFFGGMKYQDSREPSPVAMESAIQDGQAGPTQPGGPMGGNMQGAMGEVTAVSSSSITIEDIRMGTTSTYSITSSTEILDSGEAAKVSDIEVGDNVMVVASSTDSERAEQIMINPGMGGPSG
jgi:hypothetical protein